MHAQKKVLDNLYLIWLDSAIICSVWKTAFFCGYNQGMWHEFPSPERFIPEAFSREPRLVGDNPRAVIFGNSGLRFHLVKQERGFEENRQFHFTPEGKMLPAGFRAKYAKMLGAAFFGVWSWLNCPPTGQETTANKFTEVRTVTNETLASSLANLFTRYHQADLVHVRPFGYGLGMKIQIDLRGFKSLSGDDPLIQQLRRYDLAARELKITA